MKRSNYVKKALGLLLVGTILMVSAAACTKASETQTGQPDRSAPKEVTNFNPKGYPVVNSPITITVSGPLNPSTPTWKGMNLFTHLTKVTGIQFDFEEYTNDVWKEKKSLLFASDDLPDLFIGAGLTSKEQIEYGKSGQLIELNSLIDNYGENIKEAFNKIPDAKAMSTSSNGKIYTLPLINQLPRDMHQRYWISTTWLKNVGKEVPKTLDEYYSVLTAFKERDANGNGITGDEVPLSGTKGDCADGLILNALGLNTDSPGYKIIASPEGKVFCMNTSEQYKEYLKFMNRLYKEKLLDNDVFVQTVEQFNAKGQANLLGSFHSAASYITCGSKIGYDYTQFDALTSKLNSKKMVSSSTGISIGHGAITKANKYPEATLRLLDYCFTEAGSSVARNGEEGVGWKWVDKEKGVWENLKPEGYDNTQTWRAVVTAISAIPSWYRVDYQLGLGTRDAFWLNDMTAKFSYPYFVPKYPQMNFSNEELEKMVPIENDVTSYIAEARARFILGTDDIDKTWDSYVKTIDKMGIKTIVEIHQKNYDLYLKSMK